jgi:hypothetical protein
MPHRIFVPSLFHQPGILSIMNTKPANLLLPIFLLALFSIPSLAQRESKKQSTPIQIQANPEGLGDQIRVEIEKGKSFNHPSFAIWMEDMQGNYLQTLFVTKSVGKSIWQHGDSTGGQWKPGPVRRPASLPYWAHKRGIKAPDGYMVPSAENPVADAYTGATPKGSFSLSAKTDQPLQQKKFRLLLEVNQTWDWNASWTNNLFPEDLHYKSSAQPALVYAVTVDLAEGFDTWVMHPIGHSHPSGENGKLYTDLSSLSTALQIILKASVHIPGK